MGFTDCDHKFSYFDSSLHNRTGNGEVAVMRVFQHPVTQRNITQRKSSYATKSVADVLFMQPTVDAITALAASFGAPQANRNGFYFSATPKAKSPNQGCDYVQPMRHCGTLKQLRRCHCGTLRCVTECCKTRITAVMRPSFESLPKSVGC